MNVSMPNPDMLEMPPVSHTMRNLDLKQPFWTAAEQGAVVFCYWRYKAFRLRDKVKEWGGVCVCMTGNEAMETFGDV